MASINPILFGYNYTGEKVKNGEGKTSRMSSADAKVQNFCKVLSYIPIINNIVFTVLLVRESHKVIKNPNFTKLEKCAAISRWTIAATGFGFVFLPVDLIATLVKAVQYYRQQHATA